MKSILDTTKWRYNPAWSLEDDKEPVIWKDKRLSTRAKGLWGYMRSKPGNWDFSAKRIAEENLDSKNTIARTLNELEDHGYLSKHKLANGRMHYSTATEPYIGVEPKIKRSPLEGLEVIMEPPKDPNLPQYRQDIVEHLELAYSAYYMTRDEAKSIIEENDLYDTPTLSEWMLNNYPDCTTQEPVNF